MTRQPNKKIIKSLEINVDKQTFLEQGETARVDIKIELQDY